MFGKFREIDKNTYYYKYMRQAYIFEGIGIAGVIAAVLINELTGRSMGPAVILIGGIGLLFLVTGGSSAQPHVMIKSFAALLSNEPSDKNAREFIQALEYSGTVHLVRRSQNMVQTAMMSYERSAEADPEILQQLQNAVALHIRNKRL